MSKKFTVMHGDKRVAEERAEEIEEGNDAVGVLKRHGRAPGDQLKQRHHRAEGADTESQKVQGTNKHVRREQEQVCVTNKDTHMSADNQSSSPSDHFSCH